MIFIGWHATSRRCRQHTSSCAYALCQRHSPSLSHRHQPRLTLLCVWCVNLEEYISPYGGLVCILHTNTWNTIIFIRIFQLNKTDFTIFRFAFHIFFFRDDKTYFFRFRISIHVHTNPLMAKYEALNGWYIVRIRTALQSPRVETNAISFATCKQRPLNSDRTNNVFCVVKWTNIITIYLIRILSASVNMRRHFFPFAVYLEPSFFVIVTQTHHFYVKWWWRLSSSFAETNKKSTKWRSSMYFIIWR